MKRNFTNSELSAYQDCPFKWYFKYDQKLTPGREQNKLSFGRIMHEALHLFYAKNYETANAYLETQHNDALQNAGDDEQVAEIEQSRLLMKGMLLNYGVFAKAHDDFKVVELETQHTVPIIAPSGNKSSQFEYSFKPDQVIERNGGLWLHEFKTAATIDTNYVSNLVLDEQMSRYTWALEKATGKTVEGAVYSILRKKLPVIPEILKNKSLSKAKNIDTTYDVYLSTINANGLNVADYQEILDILKAKGNSFIIREVVLRNKREKSECEKRLYTLCKTLSTDAPVYKCPGRDCTWKCDFRILCVEDNPEARATFKTREDYHPELKQEEKVNG